MGLRLTSAGDYAIRSMIFIASLPEGAMSGSREIARAQGIPESFMAKILRGLVRAGLLRSFRGAHGGFGLARPGSEITLLDVVEAIEGPLSLTDCAPDPRGCERSDECPANAVWLEVQSRMAEVLRDTSLEGLVSARRRNRRVVYNIGAEEAVSPSQGN